MRLGDFLYFAPGVRFTKLDLESPSLGEIWERRIRDYYLAPAAQCVECRYAFAAGLLLTSTIDALSRLQHSQQRRARRYVRGEFTDFIVSELPSFRDGQLAERFYHDFRNGLTHEGRIKNAGEFSWEHQSTVHLERGILSVNPKYLAEEVSGALTRFVALVVADESARRAFAVALRSDFTEELADISITGPAA